MRVLMFQDRFVQPILQGRKLHTIRKTARCTVGNVLSLRRWTGKPYRSKQEIFASTICASVEPIHVCCCGVWVDGEAAAADALARADGFANFGEMYQWFCATHDTIMFDGWLIKWPGIV